MPRSCFALFSTFVAAAFLVVGCAHNGEPPVERGIDRLFPTDEQPVDQYPNCVFTSPKWYEDDGEQWVIVSRASGVIDAVDPDTGQTDWSVELPEPEEGVKYLLSTPKILGDKLIAAYHAIDEDYGDFRGPNDHRLAHLVAVVDLSERQVHGDFPVVELAAEVEANVPGETVEFLPGQALTRPEVVHAALPDDELGKVYLGQGNTRDIQPWHGWAWEIDLDVWRFEGADEAITAVLNTTPEPDENCGTPGTSGSRDRECGGGLWAPSSHLVVDEPDGYHLILAPSNGQLELHQRNYANTLMKVEPGLEFDPKCDPDACADFDPDQPSEECMESCQNLFIPRLMEDQQLQRAPDGRCDDVDTLFECWEEMDYIGGSTPVRIDLEEHSVLVYPTKDGHSYLVDAEHLGRMYDRHRMVEMCGHHGGSCSRIWAGMVVNKPAVVDIGGESAVLVPTFMPDEVNDAGVVAMTVVEDGESPRLQRAWEFPEFGSPEAVQRFRRHSSRIAVDDHGEYAWIVDIDTDGGRLTGIRIEDGEPVFAADLAGPGRRYTLPLIRDDRVYVPSCHSNAGPGHLEGFELHGDEQ